MGKAQAVSSGKRATLSAPYNSSPSSPSALDNDLLAHRRSRRVKSRTQTRVSLDIEDSIATSNPPHVSHPHPGNAPENWKEAYDAITSMRLRQIAPVDTTGCQLAQLGETEPVAKRFATLVSLIMSTATTDIMCDEAVKKLRKAVGGSLTVASILAADESIMHEAIRKGGLADKKVKYLKATAQILHDKHNSDVPQTARELTELPGVGPKVANLTLSMAWNIHTGIGVDVHVDRITNRLGWHKPSTLGQPKKTRQNLESWLPRELWYDINNKMVGFGQTVCAAEPQCSICDLHVAGLCPSSVVNNGSGQRQMKAKGSSPNPEVEVEWGMSKG